jgi:hypothetical protein
MIRILHLIALVFTLISAVANSQTYYNPSRDINVNITIREPYKPINYAEIGRNFSNAMAAEINRREQLKKYYDDIYYETKSAIQESTVLSQRIEINQKILRLQEEAIENTEMLNRLLKSGYLKPNNYESKLKSLYYSYMSGNRSLLNTAQYHYLKSTELSDPQLKEKFDASFNKAINNISDFQFSDYDYFVFINPSSVDQNKNISNLYSHITAECEKYFSIVKSQPTNTAYYNSSGNTVPCTVFLYKAILVNTIDQYKFLFSEKDVFSPEKRVVNLPDKALVYVVRDLPNDYPFVYACYNGQFGYISKHLLSKQ